MRLGYSFQDVQKETMKLINRLSKSHFAHREEDAQKLRAWTKDEASYCVSRQNILDLLWTLLS